MRAAASLGASRSARRSATAGPPEGRAELVENEPASIRVAENLLEKDLDLQDLREEPEDLLEPPVLLPGPRAVQDVVEEKILHHRRGHPVDFPARLVDDDGPQTTDFGMDGDRHGGTPWRPRENTRGDDYERGSRVRHLQTANPVLLLRAGPEGKVSAAFCALCGADEAKDFRIPEVEDIEDQG
jgi:hypothetical protein